MASLDVRNMTRRQTPRFPYQKAHQSLLKGWEVSLVFLPESEAQALNIALRKKDYIPNVLSYATGTKSGEIIICLAEAKRQAPDFGLSYPEFCGFLFIHGLMHLKGHRHGPTMDKMERAAFARFSSSSLSLHETTHRSRHRHRNPPDTRRGGGRGAR